MPTLLNTEEPISLVKALVDYFGSHPDPEMKPVREFKALTEKDKLDLREMLSAEGYNLIPPK